MPNENLSIDEWLEQMLGVVKDPETGEFEYKAGNPISTANPEPEEPEKIEVTPIQPQEVTPIQPQTESSDSALEKALQQYREAAAAKKAREQMVRTAYDENADIFAQVEQTLGKTK